MIRGPASAVWGANALNGVVNVITKSPREAPGTSGVFGFGGFDRGDAGDAGTAWYVSGTHAQAVNDRWAYKISAGGYSQDALARPTGTVPCDRSDVCSGTKATYPPFANKGTGQPKFDGRADYDYPDGAKLSFSGGVAGTSGIMHTGIGPFSIDSGSVMGYAKATYTRKTFRGSFFTNILNGDATNLLAADPLTGQAILFNFNTKTYDFEASDVTVYKSRHVFSYGGNLRFNPLIYDRAPGANNNRTEFGVYGQDEIFLGPHFRWVMAGVSTTSTSSRTPPRAADDVYDQAARGSDVPRLVPLRLLVAVGQQFPDILIASREPRRVGGPANMRCRSTRWGTRA